MSYFSEIVSILKEIFRIKHKHDLDKPDKDFEKKMNNAQKVIDSSNTDETTKLFEDLRD